MGWKCIALLVALSAAASARAQSQGELNAFADKLGVRLEIIDNQPANCPGQSGGCFLSELSMSIPEAVAPELQDGRFQLYFSSVSPIIQADSDAFTSQLINGDLNLLQPKPGVRLQPGATYRIKIWSQGHFYSAFYPMPNMFLVAGQLKPALVAATRPVADPDSELETLPFVAPMTDEPRLATSSPGDATQWRTPERAFDLYERPAEQAAILDAAIVPSPVSAKLLGGPAIDLRHGVRISLDGIVREEIAAALADLKQSGVGEASNGPLVSLRIAPDLKPESYRLTARDGAIAIDAADSAGASYALESLAQQAAHDGLQLRPVAIEDSPRFPYRGLHLDLARNFHSKAEVLALIRQMGVYKLNTLHLHLGDDEGWRLEIALLPELTEVGGYRCFDPSETHCLLPQLGSGPDRDTPVNGFLSRADYVEILKAAKARHIAVIPEFDMPGHSRAAIRSMEARYRRLMAAGKPDEAAEFRLAEPGDATRYRSIQNYDDNTLNVCLDSTYRFIDAVVDELAALHKAAGVPLRTYHLGADETAGAWTDSPACKVLMAKTGLPVAKLGPMFIARVGNALAAKNIMVAGWSDGLDHVDPAAMPKAVQSDVWGDLFTTGPAEAHRTANRGWKTVLAFPNALYFDVPYAPDPLERGYDWPTRGTDTFKVFTFVPENLPANASVMKDIHDQPVTVADAVPLAPGATYAGMQANLWSETVRSDRLVDYMLFPRLIAFAERAWHRGDWEPDYSPGTSYSYADGKVDLPALEADWSAFSAKLPQQLSRLDSEGISYRIAPPGARIVDSNLEADSEFPGQRIEYRTVGGQWMAYRGPIKVSGPVELRTLSYDGKRASRTVTVAP